VISPAGPIESKRLLAGLKEIQSWGYSSFHSKHADGRNAYLSALDDHRLDDLIAAFTDPDIKAVLCSRGGYGSGRLLDRIPYDKIQQNPRIFVGFSDVTALNWAFYAKTGLVTFTGPTLGEIGNGLPEIAADSFLPLIGKGELPDPFFSGAITAVRPGSAEGRLFPGCLSIIVTLLGTPYLPDLHDGILLIEDVGEKPYRIDRMLTHLKNAGILDQISALLIGTMLDCWPRSRKKQHLPLEEILLDLTAAHPIPIFSGYPYGHHPDRLALPVGVNVGVSAEGSLRLLEKPHP
jgi:muramoyltetrapeptide carboxypeptidase